MPQNSTYILTPNDRLARFLNKTSTTTHPIVPIHIWMKQYINPYEHILLNHSQEWALWESILNASHLIPVVQQAWKILNQWDINLTQLKNFTQENHQLFFSAATKFKQICDQNHWIDATRLPSLIINTISVPPKKLILFNFDEHPPQLHRLFNTLNKLGTEIETQDQRVTPKKYYRVQYPDPDTELEEMIAWAKIEIHQNHHNIACIIPNLHQCRAKIKRLFARHFPEKNFNISLGSALSEHPLIDAAMHSLKNINSSKLLKPSQWYREFVYTLELAGWPGEKNLDSEASQVFQKFQDSLIEFNSVDLVLNHIAYEKAFDILQNLMQSTIFQAKNINQDRPSIDILGILEAAGLIYDKIWIMGMDNQTWPTPPSPSPFLPLAIQKQYQLPHSSAIRELEFCQKLSERFCQSAEHMIISMSVYRDDQIFSISPLFKHFPEQTLNLSENPPFKNHLESISDSNGPPILGHTHKGGSRLLNDQSACPFRAFAKFRLGATADISPVIELTPMERGILVHRALELFWLQTKNHETLIQYSESELDDLLKKYSKQALTALDPDRISELNPFFLELEQSRLINLLTHWLNFEKTRDSFEIDALEKTQHIFNLKTKIDRIDKVDQNYVILDYKTGKTATNVWFGDRPDDLQLPLYSFIDKNITGIGFAQINAEEIKLKWINKTDPKINWETLKLSWKNSITWLLQEFSEGLATVTPKDPIKTCAYCDLKSFCRLYEK